jgi:hypothetical protein
MAVTVAVFAFGSMALAAGVAALLTSGRDLPAWPAAAGILQVLLLLVWVVALSEAGGLSSSERLPAGAGLGVLTIAAISLLLRRRRGAGNLPEAWVVRRWADGGKRKRYFFSRRWR